MKKKKLMAFLLAFAMIISLFSGVGTMKVEAATPTWIEAYDKASYEMTSPNFTMKVGGTPVDVVQYFYKENVRVGYSYAHLAYEGTATFEITCLQGNIEAVDASPHSYNMDVKIDGNKFTFDLEQKKSRYMVFDVRANDTTYQLIVAADPKLDLEAPVVDGVKVVSAKDGMPATDTEEKIGGLNSSNNPSAGKSNTEKIQKIITRLSENGGGTLYFPEGVYPFVTIDATSNVTLYLDKGAVLRGSGIRTDYDWNTTGQNGIQAKKRDIRIENVENFKIIGKGMVDANSIVVSQEGKTSSGSRELNNDPQPDDWYPDGWNDYRKGIVDGNNSDGIEFTGVTFKDATGWTFNIKNSKNIEMYNVKMLDDYTVVHSDGYDIVSCQDVVVDNCLGVCGDDVFCPKGDTSGAVMKNYLFKDSVAYAEGGAGCKIGVQARSDVSNIEFNNIDVIRGYRGFTIAHDEGNGNWDGIRFINIRTEKLHIPSFSTSSADNYGQYTATPFTLWLRSDGSVKNVEVTNCSFESISNLRAMIKGKSDNGMISNVTFNNLTMEGRTVTSLDDPRISVGSYVDEDSFKFNNTEVYNPETTVYEAENATLANGAKTTQEDKDGKYSGAYKVSHLGLVDGKQGTATFNVNVEKAGEYDVEIYSITKGPRVFHVTVNDEAQKVVTCNGDGWTLQGRATTKLQLKAGGNKIVLGNPNDAAPDLDKIEIINAGDYYDANDTDNTEDVIVNQPVSLMVEKGLFTLAGSAKVNNSGLIGDVGGPNKGTVTFNVQAEEEGNHILRLYYATKEDREVSVQVNEGELVTTTCPNTGSYTTVGANPTELIVKLEAGENAVTIGGVGDAYAPNIDRVAVTLSNDDAQATVSDWIDAIPEPATTADKAYVDAVKEAYDSLTDKDMITNASKLEMALEEVEGRSFFTLAGETAVTAGAATIVTNPENAEDYHIGNLGGPNHGTVTFTTYAEEAGERTLKIYYSTIGARDLNVAVNDANPVTLNAPSTGSWDEPGATPLTLKVNLKAGENTITLSGNGDNWAPNIDRIEIALTDKEIQDTTQAMINNLPDADDFEAADQNAYEKLVVKVEAVNALYESLDEAVKANVDKGKLEAAQSIIADKEAAGEEDPDAAQKEADQKAADAVIALISNIGEVTLDSEDEIAAAKEAYDKLSDAQKALVTNYNVLSAAESDLAEKKKDKEAADEVVAMIDGIGEVTLDSEDAIADVREAYDALTAEQKDYVSNYEVLADAEQEIAEQIAAKKETEDMAAADTAIAAINRIGSVTLESEETIKAARKAYDALTDDQQRYVTNYEALVDAEQKYTQLKEEYEQAAEDKAAQDKIASDAVIAAIDSIGTVTLNSEDAIVAARKAYDALTADQKQLISDEQLKVLTNAEAQLVELKDEAEQAENQKAADAVIAAIKNIGTVTLNSEASIQAAEEAYKNLTEEQKALVTNYEDLTKAGEEYAKLKEEYEQAAADKAAQDKIAADAVIAAINNIGTEITLEDAAIIQEVQAAYEKLSDDQKNLISAEQLAVLNNAVVTIEDLQEEADKAEAEKAEADQKAADTVIELISLVGTVTLESEENIKAAREAYDALTEEQKKLVTNYGDLVVAENDLERQKEEKETADNQAAAEAVIEAINKIGTVTLESEESVKAVREAYDALTEEQKKLVTNYKDLETAETEVAKQKAEKEAADKEAADKEAAEKEAAKKAADQKAADAVIEAINKIGTVTADSEKSIQAIREAYDALTEDQKKLVTNYKDLEAAETEVAKQKAENEEVRPSIVLKGDVYTYKNVKYKVTKADMTGKGTVEVIGPKKKTQKTVTILSTVKIEGATFKVTSIRNNAFKNCKKLKKVTIGKNVTKIGKNAFSGCSKLKTIKIQTKKLKSVGKNAFKGIHKNAKIKVPSSKLKKYKKLLKKKGQKSTVKITK